MHQFYLTFTWVASWTYTIWIEHRPIQERSCLCGWSNCLYSWGKPSEIEKQLETLVNKIHPYYHTWKLTTNINKCETIHFRPPLINTNRDTKKKKKKLKKFPNRNELPKRPTQKTCQILRNPFRPEIPKLFCLVDHFPWFYVLSRPSA